MKGNLSKGLNHLKVEHRSPAASGFAAGLVSIDGVVTKLDTLEMWFQGTNKQVRHGETSCVREGLTLFAITQNRKYWRLREPHMDSCPGATDYIDIYF